MRTERNTAIRERQRERPKYYSSVSYTRNNESRKRFSLNNEKTSENSDKTVKGSRVLRGFILFVKQTATVAVIILLYMLIKKGNFEFANNCLSSLGRAIRWEVDLNALQTGVVDWFNGIVQFWSDLT